MTLMTLITVIISAVATISAALIVVRKRASRPVQEPAIRDLCDHYVAGIEALTRTYLLEAPPDEEWLAGIKAQAGAPDRPQGTELPASSGLKSGRASARAAAESEQITRAGRQPRPRSGSITPRSHYGRQIAGRLSGWTRDYLRDAVLADLGCALVGVLMAAQLCFGDRITPTYLALSLALPVLWLVALWLAGAYDVRFIGTGSDEFRKVLNSGVSLTAAVAIFSYAVNLQLSRGYVVIALPSITLLDVAARFALRKRLHRQRASGRCMHSVVAVGHEPAVANLITELKRDRYHGLTVVGACVAAPGDRAEVAGVPVYGGLDDITAAVNAFTADTVAVLACPEMDGIRLRSLAWALEKTSTDLCVSPALLDVAGPRTTIRPTAGLTLLHVDHPQLSRAWPVFKDLFDRCAAAAALIMLAPLMGVLAAAIWLHDRGPALITQVRVGKDGRVFRIYKFRTMVVNAERHSAQSPASSDSDVGLLKLRKDPRITTVGAHLRRWSIDDLPQLFNVFLGDMSLVGSRPALPDEAEKYAEHVRRRLKVKPGLTGLWQVNGRSDLSWDDSVWLDLLYVKNCSFALDMEILWKTGAALLRDTSTDDYGSSPTTHHRAGEPAAK